VRFLETGLDGVFFIEPEKFWDDRGWFARLRCEEEFGLQGLERRFVQTSLSFNEHRGVLRGLHLQAAPRTEVKLVRCVRGAIFDVVVDLRPKSPSFLRHAGFELKGEDHCAVYIPKGCAHGFQALSAGSEILYEISEFHSPDHARGFRWNDPAFGIEWPVENPIMVDRDRAYGDFHEGLIEW
jgi:dTDP-4-dehydrorhamnose 3,5-epimerase